MIQPGEEKYKDALKAMWKFCFPNDTDAFTAFYFDKVYKNDESLVCLENDMPVAFLQMIPYPMKTGGDVFSGGYLSGVMTHPDFRGKGYMKQLMQAAFDSMIQKGYVYAFLIPQTDRLWEVYEKYGFVKAFSRHREKTYCPCACKSGSLSPVVFTSFETVMQSAAFSGIFAVYAGFLTEKPNAVLKTPEHFTHILRDFFNEKGVLFVNEKGIAFAFDGEKEVRVKEFFYRDETVKQDFITFIGNYFSKDRLTVFNPPDTPVIGYRGMLKPLRDSSQIITDMYMSMMLE